VAARRQTWPYGSFHGRQPEAPERYLNEFVFRFDRRWHETSPSRSTPFGVAIKG
jgi:hypothetical protein